MMPQNNNTDVAEVVCLIERLASQRFFGEVTIKFHDGAVTLVRKSENLKVGGNGWNNRRRDLGDEHKQH